MYELNLLFMLLLNFAFVEILPDRRFAGFFKPKVSVEMLLNNKTECNLGALALRFYSTKISMP